MKSAAWSPVSVESRGSGDPGQPGRATFAIWRPYTHCDSFMSDGPSGRWAAGFHANSCKMDILRCPVSELAVT